MREKLSHHHSEEWYKAEVSAHKKALDETLIFDWGKGDGEK
jgi:hypothetical protein